MNLAAPSQTWIIHCDGTALPNPGRIGIGAVLLAPDGTRHTRAALQGQGCNNEAECRAMLAALDAAKELGATHLLIHSDSRVLIDHLSGLALTRIAHLVRLFDELALCLQSFSTCELRWLPRHRNSEADALARGVLGLTVKTAHVHKRRKRR